MQYTTKLWRFTDKEVITMLHDPSPTAQNSTHEPMELHVTLYELPDGMFLATCAEIPPCQVLRANKDHAFTDARRFIKQFLDERTASGRPFTLPEIRTVRI